MRPSRSLDCICSMSYADELLCHNCGSGQAEERRCGGGNSSEVDEERNEEYDRSGKTRFSGI